MFFLLFIFQNPEMIYIKNEYIGIDKNSICIDFTLIFKSINSNSLTLVDGLYKILNSNYLI